MTAVPMSWRSANAFVRQHHRHSTECRGQKFAVGAMKNGQLIGVAMCGRPTSRVLDDGKTLEVLRCCTDGARNGCSFLYARCMDIADRMGYLWVITFTLFDERGTSIECCRRSDEPPVFVRGKQADTPARRRKLRTETPDRWRWTLAGSRQECQLADVRGEEVERW